MKTALSRLGLLIIAWTTFSVPRAVYAADVDASYSTGSETPVSASGYTATGKTVDFTLNYAPPAGTILSVVNNTSLGFISGTFDNLANGDTVDLTYSGHTYSFVAWYYGGTGNDLVLVWKDSQVVAWGRNSENQLGDNTDTTRFLAAPVVNTGALAGKTVVAIAAGQYHSLALCSDGTLAAWGANGSGQVGNNSTTNQPVPVAISGMGALSGKTVIAISAGGFHNLALCSDGSLASWGYGANGQLGNNDTTDSLVPISVLFAGDLSGKSVAALASGVNHNLVLCTDGTVVGWGLDDDGQLGDDSSGNKLVPVAASTSGVLDGKTVIALATGKYSTVAACSDGTVATWGFGNYGQLGNGTNTTNARTPVAVNAAGVLSGKTVSSVRIGQDACVALCTDGTLVTWGRNIFGELGDNSTNQSNVPVAVLTGGAISGKTATGISAGVFSAFARCSDGTAFGWGLNENGSLGDSTDTNALVPVQVSTASLPAGSRFTAISGSSTGGSHSLGIVGTPLPPEIAVEQPVGTEITDGSSSDLGTSEVGVPSTPVTFTIKNTGIADLVLGTFTKEGSQSSEFTVSAPGSTTIAGGGSTTFTITFTPTIADSRSFFLHIPSNDPNRSSFDIIISGTGVGPVALPSGAVAWLRAEDNATDSSGSNNHGTLNGTVPFVTGYVGKAFSFDGSSSSNHIRIPNSPSLQTANFTIDYWVYFNTTQNAVAVTKRSASGSGDAWQVGITHDGSNFVFQFVGHQPSGFVDWYSGPLASPVGVWTHIAATYDGATIHGYVNGVEVLTQAATLDLDTRNADIYVGTHPIGYAFNGLIDELQLFNRALTYSEVLEITNAGAQGTFAAPAVASPTSSAVTPVSATLGGNVTSDGNSDITERGIVYAATATNSNPQIGGTGAIKVAGTGTTGVFTVNVTGLTANTGYSFTAYATNAAGTSYTSAGTFTTGTVDYTVTTSGNAIVVTDVAGNGETLTISETNAGTIKFAAAGRVFAINGSSAITGDSGDLSLSGITSITANAGGGNDTVTSTAFTGSLPSLTINGDAGTDTVNLNGDITFSSNASLAAAAETVNTAASADLITSGTGTVGITADNVAINSTSTLVSARTVTLVQQTAARGINIGGAGSGSQLELSDAELDRVTSGTTVIGNSSAGTITFTNTISHGNSLSVVTGAGMTGSAGTPITLAAGKNLSLAASAADINVAGIVTVPGTTTLSNTSNAVFIDNASNNFTGAVTVSLPGNSSLSLRDVNDLIIGGLNVNLGGVSVTAVGITQTGPIVQGASSFSGFTFAAGAGALILDNTGNDFTGVVRVTNSGANAVTVVDANSLSFNSGSSVGSGAFTATALNGSLTTNSLTFQGDATYVASTNISRSGTQTRSVAGTGTLTYRANGNITGSSDITATTGSLNVVFNSDRDANSSGNVSVLGNITTNGGSLTIGGGADPATMPAYSVGSWGVSFNSSAVSTAGGNISIRAQGVTSGAGFTMSSTTLNAGAGNITIDANGGVSGFNGITINAGTNSITSSGGSISITGTAGTNTSGVRYGIELTSMTISNTGTGTISLAGLATSSGSSARGVKLDGTTVSVVNGNLSVTGAGGASANGVMLENTTTAPRILSTGSGSITISGSSATAVIAGINVTGASTEIGGTGATCLIDLIADATNLAAGTVNTTNTVTFKPLTAGRTIRLGAELGTDLSLTDAELDLVTAGSVVIGDSNSGAITIAGALSPANYKLLSLTKNVTWSSGVFTSDIGATAADYEKLSVTGTVTLSSAQFTTAATGGFTPGLGQTFTILDNDGSDAISGTFIGAPEGTKIVPFAGSSAIAGQISYVGGSGNDIVITTVAAPAEIAVEQPVGTNIADAGSKAFGSVNVGSNASLTFTIKNVGGLDLTGLTITKDGTNAGDFTVTADPTAPVTGGNSTTFTVQFAPLASGSRTAAIHIASNDSDENPFDITLTGTGLAPEIAVEQPVGTNIADGGSKDFGSTALGASTPLTFTIKNTGNADLTGLTITKDGTNAADFTVTANPTAPVTGPSGTTTFTVQFAPSALGSRTAAIHIASNDGDENPFDINLTGFGTVTGVWTVTQWTGDSTSNVTAGQTLWGYSFGTASSASINGVTFTGVTSGSYSDTNITVSAASTFNNDTNNLTALGGTSSGLLARDFMYQWSSGFPVVKNLTVGQTYTVSFYSVGFENPGNRPVDFSSGGNTLRVDQDRYGNDNGIRVDYTFTATAATQSFSMTPVIGGTTWHLYGLALRTASATTLASGGASWWKAEDNANDSVGTNHGTLQNGATFAAGLVKRAFSLDGVDDYISVPSSASLDVGTSTDFTVEGWIKLNGSQSNFAGLVTKAGAPFPYNGFQFTLVQNKLTAEFGNGSAAAGVLQASTDLNDSNWHHIAMVVNRAAQNVTLYVDGRQDLSTNSSVIAGNLDSGTSLYLGVERGVSTRFKGLMDEMTFYRAALSAAQIQAIHSSASTGKVAPEINVTGNGVNIANADATPSTGDHTDFGSTNTVSATVVRTFTIQNSGDTGLTLSGTPKVAVSGTHAADFSVTTQPTSPVTAGGSTTFQVTFDPSAIGVRTATVSIASNDSDENPYTFAIQGTGISVPVIASPTSANITLDSATLGGNVTSDGGLSITERGVVYSVTATNADPQISGTGVTKVTGTGTTGVFTVDVTGLTEGTAYSFKAYAINSLGTSYTSPVSTFTTLFPVEIVIEQPVGTNVADGGGRDFGSVPVGSTSSLSFTITNSGSGDLTGLATSIDGTNAADFAVTAAPTAPVAGAASTTFTVRFAPASAGAKTAALHIASNDADENPFDINLTAEGLPAETIAEVAGGELTVTDANGGTSEDALTISRQGANVRIQSNHTLAAGAGATQVDGNTVEVPLASLTAGLTFESAAGDDILTVDFDNGSPIPAGGITFNGGNDTDALRVIGTGESAVYSPSATTTGDGVLTFSSGTLAFTGLEPVDYDMPGGALTLSPAGDDDVVSVKNDFLLDGTTAALELSGTSSGVAFESIYVRGAAVTIDTTAVAGADTITITSASNAHTNGSLTITAGSESADVIHVNGTTTFTGATSLNAATVNLNADVTNVVTGAVASEVNVTSPAQVQDGVDVAGVGAIVTVGAGTYPEAITVAKSLTLKGAKAGMDARTRTGAETILNGNAGSTCLRVTANNVTIDGFTVQDQTSTTQFGAGIVLGASTSGAQVINNIIKDNLAGLFLASSSSVTQTVIAQNVFKDNDAGSGSVRGTAIYSDPTVSGSPLTNILIEDNTFTGNNFVWAINLQNATSATIKENAFETGNAVRLANVDNSSVTDNAFTGFFDPLEPGGFQLTALQMTAASSSGCTNVIVSGNTFTDRKASAVSVAGACGSLTLAGNVITQDVSLYAINSNRYMMSFNGLTGTSAISGNSITLSGTTPSGAGVNGMEVSGNGTNTVNVTANSFDGGDADVFTGTNDSHGISIAGGGLGLPSTPTPVFSTVNITNNVVTGFVQGIASASSLNARTTVTVSSNDLSGNSDKSIFAAAASINVLNASGNWHGATNPATVAASVGGRMDYTPWLGSGTDTDAGQDGFQGDYSALYVDDDSLQVGATGRITEALGLLTDPGAVTVMGGTYAETVDTTSKAVTLAAGFGTTSAQVTVTGNLTLSGDDSLPVQLNGNTAGTGYDQWAINGTVILNGAELPIGGTYDPGASEVFALIANDNTDPIGGIFDGLTEGAFIPALSATISYVGGTGNDVVLTEVHPDIAIEQPAGTGITDGGSKDFGNVEFGVGASTSLTFTVANTGTLEMTGVEVSVDGANDDEFVITSDPDAVVAPGDSTTFTVEFTPGATGVRTAAVHIASDDADENPFDITVTGTGVTPEITVEQPVGTGVTDGGSRSFGDVGVNSTSSLTFTIKNTGTSDLTDLTIDIDGTHAGQFEVTEDAVTPVAPGESTTFTVELTPDSIGLKTAVLHIASNDLDEDPFDITLTGTGVSPEIAVEQPVGTNLPSGGSRSYGFVQVNSTGSLVFTIKNTGTADLTGLDISVDGDDAAMFVVTANPTPPVSAPTGTTTFTVQFTPTSRGPKSAALHIESNDLDENPFDINLTGIGGEPGAALAFDGNDDTMEIAAHADFNTETFTIEGWVKPSAGMPEWSRLWGTESNHGDLIIRTGSENHFSFAPVIDGQFAYVHAPTNWVAGQWYHVAGVVDHSTIRLFVNGLQVASRPLTGTWEGDPGKRYIGNATSPAPPNRAKAVIDEVRYWNYARNCDQIAQTYDGELTGAEPGLVAYYQFNQGVADGDNGSVTTVTDVTGHGHAGTLTNFGLADDDNESNWTTPGGVVSGVLAASPLYAEMDVKGNSLEIYDGDTTPRDADHTDFGATDTAVTRTFTIENSGTIDLNVTGITLSGDHAADFTVGGLTTPVVIAPLGSRTFTITATTTATEARAVTVQIANSDCDEGTYDFVIQSTPPIELTTTAGAIVVTDPTDAGGTISLVEEAGFIKFTNPTRSFRKDGTTMQFGESAEIELTSVTSITVNGGSGDDNLHIGAIAGSVPSLAIVPGAGDDAVSFDGDIAFASGASLSVQAASAGADSVSVAADASLVASGSGAISIAASKSVTVPADASLQTADGNLTIEANQQTPASTGSFNGITVGGSINTTGSGALTLKGRGGDGTGSQVGVRVQAGGDVVGGTGLVTVEGTGGASTGLANYGILITGSGSSIASTDGNVRLKGLEGGGTSGMAIVSQAGAVRTYAATGSVTLAGNSMSLDANSAVITPSGGSVTLLPGVNGTGISLGLSTNVVGGPLGLTDAELDRINTGTLNVGNTDSGNVVLAATISRAAATDIVLTSGAAIAINAGTLDSGGGDVTFNPGTVVTAAGSSLDVNAGGGTIRFGGTGTLSLAVNGTAVNTGYHQFKVAGAVDLDGAQLVLTGSYSPQAGQSFVIIDNTGAGATANEFTGKQDGSNLTVGTALVTINYDGGTGNDVTLGYAAPSLTQVKTSVTVNEGSPATNNGAFSDLQGGVTLSVSPRGIVTDIGGGKWTWAYTPGNGSGLTETITVTATDDSTPPLTASVSFPLTVNNVTPVSLAQAVTVLEDSAATPITLGATDPGNDIASYAIVAAPTATKGSLSALSGNPVSFTPAAGYVGTAPFTFNATDSDGAVSNTATVTVTVKGVNDKPTFVAGANRSHAAGFTTAQTVAAWATSINDGDPEVAQTLTFTVTAAGDSIFTNAPAINSAGTLTYRTNGNAGTATLTVVLKDSGGTADGGVDTSTSQTFTITVADDTTAPTVTITAPGANANVAENTVDGTVAVTGTAADNKKVQKVEVQINGGSFVQATTTVAASGLTASYTLPVTPVAGLNTLGVRSTDAAGNVSTTVTRSFTYVVMRAFAAVITPADSGTVAYTPALVSGKAQLGKTYTVTATAKAGFFFDEWQGTGVTGATIDDNKITFVMTEAITSTAGAITAKFMESPFESGSYTGLAQPAAGTTPSQNNLARFSGTLAATGSFTAQVNFGGTVTGFTAVFDPHTGDASGTSGGLSYDLHLDLVDDTDKITGTVTQTTGGDVSDVDADRATFSSTNKVPDRFLKPGNNTQNGFYTVVFPALASQPGLTLSQYPQGDGVGSITVTPTGTVTLTGTLADGTAITASAPFSKTYQWPLACLIKTTSTVTGMTLGGMVQFDTDEDDSDVTASELRWFRPAKAGSAYYPDGWPAGIGTFLTGAKFTVPSGSSVLPGLSATNTAGNAKMELSDGLLTTMLTKHMNISTTNAVSKVPASDASYTLTITAASGVLGGSFTHPGHATIKPVIKGVILQKGANSGGYGFFLSPVPSGSTTPGESGGITLTPK